MPEWRAGEAERLSYFLLLDEHKSRAEEDCRLNKGKYFAGLEEGKEYPRAKSQRKNPHRLSDLPAISHIPPPQIVFNNNICGHVEKVHPSRDSMR